MKPNPGIVLPELQALQRKADNSCLEYTFKPCQRQSLFDVLLVTFFVMQLLPVEVTMSIAAANCHPCRHVVGHAHRARRALRSG
jgi:hypothetical protein